MKWHGEWQQNNSTIQVKPIKVEDERIVEDQRQFYL